MYLIIRAEYKPQLGDNKSVLWTLSQWSIASGPHRAEISLRVLAELEITVQSSCPDGQFMSIGMMMMMMMSIGIQL